MEVLALMADLNAKREAKLAEKEKAKKCVSASPLARCTAILN